MLPISHFNAPIEILFTDIDDTLTSNGRLEEEAYTSLWKLFKAGVKVVPVTGRPAGWCELIARQWPVEGIVGENGGFYFRYHENKMKRFFHFNEAEQFENRIKLNLIKDQILSEVSGCAVASDQFCRLMDLAIDFCEDVPKIENEKILKILEIFESHGAQAKISSIHVNGWFGKYDKILTAKKFLINELNIHERDWKQKCAFIGDSPNDEPMFSFFPFSFGVANIINHQNEMKFLPNYLSQYNGGKGFFEITERIIANNKLILKRST